MTYFFLPYGQILKQSHWIIHNANNNIVTDLKSRGYAYKTTHISGAL